MSKEKVIDIEGIGPVLGAKLNEAGVETVGDLLTQCCDKDGRKWVAEKSGISEHQILKFANMADLYRVKGVGSEYSELLKVAGVDTIKELRHRVPENLQAKMAEVNEEKKLVRHVPSVEQVTAFIENAKTLEPKITH
jgi:predicted flap endonuclease-1-like 5' DNA nuclease